MLLIGYFSLLRRYLVKLIITPKKMFVEFISQWLLQSFPENFGGNKAPFYGCVVSTGEAVNEVSICL